MINNDRRVAFVARAGNAGENRAFAPLYSTHRGSLSAVAVEGNFGNPVLSESNHIAFIQFDTGGNSILWDAPGDLQFLIGPGSVVDEATVLSVFPIVGLTSEGTIAFMGSVQRDGQNRAALMLRELNGFPRLVVESGTLFDASGKGDLRVISNIVAGGLSETGKVAFRLTFTDGTSGHFTASFGGSIVGDLDGDGDVDLADLALLLADFGCSDGDCSGDVDADGATDLADLAQLLANFGT